MNKNFGKEYITLEEGTDFRKIAKIMTQKGYPLNHATARNQVIHAMKDLLTFVSSELGMKLTENQVNQLVEDKTTHEALQDVIYLAYKKSKKEVSANAN